MKTLLLFAAITFSLFSLGQTKGTQTGNWTVKNPFEQSVFIENKGQFTEREKKELKNDILYYGRKGKLHLYFSKDELVFHYDSIYRADDEEAELKGNKEEKEETLKMLPVFTKIHFEGALMDTKIEAETEVSNYYTYGNPLNISGSSGIIARAWKKLVYHNIYKATDIEFFFPEKGGIEYNIILHPGADASQIKMNYSDNARLFLSDENLTILSPCGNFTDHAPVAYFEDGQPVPSSFELNGNTVSFKLSTQQLSNSTTLRKESLGQNLIIDPWITATTLKAANKAYDISYDLNGNVYVYGGTYPYQESKYTNGGVLLWTYTTNFIPTTYFGYNMGIYYGDFVVDKRSGSSYIVEAVNDSTGCNFLKINSQGTQNKKFPGKLEATEAWRIDFDYCNNLLVIALGNNYLDKISRNQTATLDSNFTTLKTYNILATTEYEHDMVLLGLDGAGNCYTATTQSASYSSANNVLFKLPLPSISPVTFQISDLHDFVELNSINYYASVTQGIKYILGNGFNGIAANSNMVLTYDGATLRKWNTAGVLVKTINLGNKPFNWGGLDIDCQGNIYAGYLKSIKVYDSNLKLIGSIPLKDTVYDLHIGVDWNVYSCGKGFVESDKMLNIPIMKTISITQTSTSSCKSTDGTANAIASFCGGVSPYTYSWSNGQSGQTATGLAPGSYTVTAKDGSLCAPKQETAVVIILGSASFTATPAHTDVICFGDNNGTATITVTGGTSPINYSWSNGSTTSGISGLAAGTYTCDVTDNSTGGCNALLTMTITEPLELKIQVSGSPATCGGVCNGKGSVIASGGTNPYSYSWSNTATVANNSTLCSGNYTVTIIDFNKCKHDTTIIITEPTAITHAENSAPATCGASNGSASVAVSGGTPAYIYSWNTNSTVAAITNIAAGTYSVTVKDAKGCVDTIVVIVPNSSPFGLNSSPTKLLCFGDNNASLNITVNGNSSPYTYLWSNNQTTSSISDLTAGVYTVSVKDVNGCIGKLTDTVFQPAPLMLEQMNRTICKGDSAKLIANVSGGTGPYSYLWNNSSGNSENIFSPETTTSYSVIITDANGCSVNQTDLITVNPVPQATFSGIDVCVGLPTTFKDSSYVTGGIINSWGWNFGDGTSNASQNPTHIYTRQGTYTVSLTASIGACNTTITHVVTVYPVPHADFTADPQPTTILNPTLTFTDLSNGGVKGSWDLGDGTTDIYSPGVNPVHTYPNENLPGGETFRVHLNIVNQYGCPDTISKLIHIDPEWTFYVPNTFTPNGDGKNDLFFGTGIGIIEKEMWIYDRWGNEIFHTKDLYGGWDGKVQGGGSNEIAQEDTYVWLIMIKEVFLKTHRLIGHVNIIK